LQRVNASTSGLNRGWHWCRCDCRPGSGPC
jgi:hypothetical protein